MQKTCDILIVGSGPAGATAALEAAKKDVNVLLIDKKKSIGTPVQCAEYIPKLLRNEIAIPDSCIAQEIIGMKTFVNQKEVSETKSPGYILHRDVFDKMLSSKAEDDGVILKTNAECISKDDNNIIIKEKGIKKKIIPKVIIGADGPRSIIGKWIESCNKEFVWGLQYTVPLVHAMNYTHVYFKNDFFGGYGWVFPKGSAANVGIGVKTGLKDIDYDSLVKILENFLNDLVKKNMIINDPLIKTMGFIPAGGPVRTVKENMLLVGDAAGHTHPITGGGIPQAVICGKIAGSIAADALQKGISTLKEYEKQWFSVYGSELQRATMRRKFLETNWNTLDKVIKKCWPTFREYYE